jgi:hypothetical protein
MPEGQYFLAGGIDLLQFLIISAELIAVQQEIDRDVICIPELAGLDSTLYYLPHLMITPASLMQVTVESIMNTATCLPAGCNEVPCLSYQTIQCNGSRGQSIRLVISIDII